MQRLAITHGDYVCSLADGFGVHVHAMSSIEFYCTGISLVSRSVH